MHEAQRREHSIGRGRELSRRASNAVEVLGDWGIEVNVQDAGDQAREGYLLLADISAATRNF